MNQRHDLRVKVRDRVFLVSWADLEKMTAQSVNVEILDVLN